MESLIEKLHDIDPLNTVSIWPLALGYWILALLGLTLVFFTYRRLKYYWSWKREAHLKLRHLENTLTEENAQSIAATLSETVRRIALQRFPRRECAALVGEEWLEWLSSKDERQFNWKEKGSFLIEVAYAPPHVRVDLKQLREILSAIKGWVK